MKEGHALISICIDREVDAHAYVACRENSDRKIKEIVGRAGERLAGFVDQHAGKGWLPVILVTDLDLPTAGEVEAIMLKHAFAQHAKDVVTTLESFRSGKRNFVFSAWFMESSNEDCQRLIEIH